MLDSLTFHNTLDIEPRPPDIKPFGCKFVFAIKESSDGSIARYSARLVAQVSVKRKVSIIMKLLVRLLSTLLFDFSWLQLSLGYTSAEFFYCLLKLKEKNYKHLTRGHLLPAKILACIVIQRTLIRNFYSKRSIILIVRSRE